MNLTVDVPDLHSNHIFEQPCDKLPQIYPRASKQKEPSSKSKNKSPISKKQLNGDPQTPKIVCQQEQDVNNADQLDNNQTNQQTILTNSQSPSSPTPFLNGQTSETQQNLLENNVQHQEETSNVQQTILNQPEIHILKCRDASPQLGLEIHDSEEEGEEGSNIFSGYISLSKNYCMFNLPKINKQQHKMYLKEQLKLQNQLSSCEPAPSSKRTNKPFKLKATKNSNSKLIQENQTIFPPTLPQFSSFSSSSSYSRPNSSLSSYNSQTHSNGITSLLSQTQKSAQQYALNQSFKGIASKSSSSSSSRHQLQGKEHQRSQLSHSRDELVSSYHKGGQGKAFFKKQAAAQLEKYTTQSKEIVGKGINSSYGYSKKGDGMSPKRKKLKAMDLEYDKIEKNQLAIAKKQQKNENEKEFQTIYNKINMTYETQIELLKFHRKSKNYHGTAKQFGIQHEEARAIIKMRKSEYKQLLNQ